MDRRDLVYLKT